MATSALFTAEELTHAVQEFVDDDDATMAERIVWGWLSPILGLDARPDPVTDQLFSWAIELGAIQHENPAGLALYQLGEERRQYSSARRNEILDEVRASVAGQTGTGGSALPRGRFPAACPYPDQARTRGYGYAQQGY